MGALLEVLEERGDYFGTCPQCAVEMELGIQSPLEIQMVCPGCSSLPGLLLLILYPPCLVLFLDSPVKC